jgi:hypothetical protein
VSLEADYADKSTDSTKESMLFWNCRESSLRLLGFLHGGVVDLAEAPPFIAEFQMIVVAARANEQDS